MITRETRLRVFSALAALCLGWVFLTPAGQESTGDPPWSQIVGPDYIHRQECARYIQEHLDLTLPGLPTPPAAGTNLHCAWDVFAWNTFAALNWPGDTTPGKRGIPDAGTSFLGNTDAGAELIWEAFKEKRELFQPDYARRWNDLGPDGQEVVRFARPSNLWNQYGGYCSPGDQKRAGTASSGPFALDKFHDQLDETAEVQSEALESFDALCQGYEDKQACMQSLQNNPVVGPRVWQGKPAGGRPLYYEVKVNYDFFDYVVNPPTRDVLTTAAKPSLVHDDVAVTNAMLGRIQLPWRSADPKNPGQNPRPVLGYQYPNLRQQDDCDPLAGRRDPAQLGRPSLYQEFVPCRVGAVHIKSAWVQLEKKEAESGLYHTSTALYYKDAGENESKSCIAVDTFGLLGLHIIQRVKTPSGNNPGGAFIFSTWEHRSILDPTYEHGKDFSYVNLQVSFAGNKATNPYPKLPYALPVTRMIPGGEAQESRTTCGLSAEQTCQVNEEVRRRLTDAQSLWQNYRLVGTQFQPTPCEPPNLTQCRKTSLAKYGQPHFLANAVIETNQGLQQFLGLPPQQPRLQPKPWCEPSTVNGQFCDRQAARKVPPDASLLNHFQRGSANVTYGGTAVNMGGCQGCHGVAQQNGYSFSFVLLDGQGGAGADTEDDATLPPTSLSASIALKLQWAGDPKMGLKATTQYENTEYFHVQPVPLEKADTWTLRPFSGSPAFGNGAGQMVIFNETRQGALSLGQLPGAIGSASSGGNGPPTIGGPHTVLVGPEKSGSSTRDTAAQLLYLVGLPPQPSLAHPYLLVSTVKNTIPGGSVQYALTVEADPKNNALVTTAIPPAPPPDKGTKLTSAQEAQAFNLLFLDGSGEALVVAPLSFGRRFSQQSQAGSRHRER